MRRTASVFVPLGLSATLLAGLLAGCGSSSSGGAGSSAPASSSAPAVTGSITVLAASSLKEAFTTIGQQFEAANPGVKVTFSFAASSALATQINSGSPADVFASASTSTMQQVVDKGGARSPTNFVKNVMEIATPPSNPAGVTSVDDLAKTSVKVALCQSQVPCGSTAQKVFTNAGITVTPVTQEPDVKSVLAKVTLGEVDAGVVYVTDVLAAGTSVHGVQIADSVNASTTYPIAALTKAPNTAGAAAFVAYVLSPAGQSVLTTDGFQSP
ncbi:MAG: molybdate ABC transporter substrate-binding protein [Actinomycetes bacterium]